MIAAAIVAAIVYGSLYPFDFISDPPSANGPLLTLVETWNSPVGRGDLIANILFYTPLGFFLARLLHQSSPVMRVITGLLAGIALSVTMELGQFYLPDRYTSMGDVYANGTGALVGAISAVVVRPQQRSSFLGAIEWDPFLALLMASWLGYRLFPFVPVIDLHKYWHAIQPLLCFPKLSPLDVYRHFVIWLAIGLMIERLFPKARSATSILLLVSAVSFARIFIVDKMLTPAEVVGGLAAAFLWFTVLSRIRSRAIFIAVLFAAVVVIEELRPFQFSPSPHSFRWIPFSSLIEASPEGGVLSFFEKVFMYGSLIWLAVRAGCSLVLVSTLAAFLVFVLELTQMYLPGRSPEITDVIIVVILAILMKLMNEGPEKVAATIHQNN